MRKVLITIISILNILTLAFIYVGILNHLITENILPVPEGAWKILFYSLNGMLISPVFVAIVKYNRKDSGFD